MLNNYYLLHRLAHVWNGSLPGAAFIDAWCHAPGELVVLLEKNDIRVAISFLTHVPIIGAFQRKEIGRPRRNAKSLFRTLRQQSMTGVFISESDRILTLKFTGGLQLQSHLYGSRANVFLVNESGQVQEAFRKGAPAELTRSHNAPEPETLDEFTERWNETQGNSVKALQRVYVRFSRDQAREVVRLYEQFDIVTTTQMFKLAQESHLSLLDTRGPLYVYQSPSAVSLIPLSTRKKDDVDVYTDIDEGIRVYSQRALSERAYRTQYEPLRKDLLRRLDKAERSTERMKTEYAQPSRADEYERLGHILMASSPFPAGKLSIELEDVFHPGKSVTIPLDKSLTSLQNAERYYMKARKARTSRSHLGNLIRQATVKTEALRAELEMLEKAKTYKDMKAFQRTHKKHARSGQPFRRYVLAPSYELWVGRNAKESEALTLRHARPFDLWLHARGVSGAHAVLRLPGRDVQPSSYLIEQAAAITAWYSKARTSSIAPVTVTPRKYVRKVRGAPLGEVTISREEVVMVEPAPP